MEVRLTTLHIAHDVPPAFWRATSTSWAPHFSFRPSLVALDEEERDGAGHEVALEEKNKKREGKKEGKKNRRTSMRGA
jgi:hypothetical protein